MRVLHFSDIHLSVPFRGVPLRPFLSKRAAGRLNLLLGRGRHFAEAPKKLEALVRFKEEQGVDLVLFTGDCTALGLDEELRRARATIHPLMDASLGFVGIPGNHDLYTRDVLRHRLFERHFGDTLGSDLPEHSADGPWPLVRLLGSEVAVVAVNGSRPNPPWRSNGLVPESQLEALRALLGDRRLSRRFLFLLTHYAPCLAGGEPDRPTHGLVNADRFLAVCAEVRRGAILCGHVHRRYVARIPGVEVPVFCAGSATLEGRESLWVFDLQDTESRAIPGHFTGGRYVLDAEAAIQL